MRISTGMIFHSGVSSMNNLSEAMLQVNQQLSTGLSVLTPADNPVAASQALNVTQASNINAQYAVNQTSATTALGLEGSQLASVSDLLTQAQQLTVQAGNATLNSTDRTTIATQLRSIFSQMLGLANSQNSSGQYMFSGNMGNTQSFSGTVETGVTYNGDNGQQNLQLSSSQQLAVSDSGNNIFQNIPAGNGYFATANAAGNGGSGVIDAGSVSDPTKWNASSLGQVTVRFAGISSVTGTVDVSAPGIAMSAGDNQFTIAVNGAAPATITLPTANFNPVGNPPDLAALQASIDTALGANVAKVSVDAANHHLVVTATGAVSGSGVAIGAVAGNGGMASLFGATPAAAPTATYYDLVDASGKSLFTGAPSSVLGGSYSHAYVAGQPIPLSQSTSPAFDLGASVTITGVPATNDAFTISPGQKQSVFATLSNLILSLESSSTATPAGSAQLTKSVSSALTNISNANNNILSVQAAIGSRENEVTSLGSINASVNLQYQQTLSNLQDVNYTQAVSNLTQLQTQLTAAQKSFAMVSQMSLFTYLP